MDCAECEAHLDAIESAVRTSSPFDVSPRGIRFRPDSQLAAMIEELSECPDETVAALSTRLGALDNQFLTLTWLHCLKTIGTRKTEEAIDVFVERMQREQLWKDMFPGPREILLFLGRTKG